MMLKMPLGGLKGEAIIGNHKFQKGTGDAGLINMDNDFFVTIRPYHQDHSILKETPHFHFLYLYYLYIYKLPKSKYK